MINSMVSAMLLMLSSLPAYATALIAIGCAAIGVAATFFVYREYLKKKFEGAKEEAKRIVEEGRAEAKSLRKEALIEAREEKQKIREELDKETKERRAELNRMESRLQSRDEQLNKKEAVLDSKQQDIEAAKNTLAKKESQLQKAEEDLKDRAADIEKELERVAGLTREEAKETLRNELIEEVKKETAQEARNIEANAKEEAEKKAKEIIALAVQRCAADHSSDLAVSVVALPNEEMKGRIIGRVGRNIRALENATGVDVIIDDTPDVVTLSAFEPIRREIAKVSLERLIADGRIHPARIEEVVDKVRVDINNQIKEAGENAVFDVGVYLHPELVKILGRLKYRTSYGQNVLQHSLEVAYLSGVMASELGVDVKLAKKAGLLHDIGKAIDHEVEGTHVSIGVELCKKYKENPQIIHAIQAHHGDVEAKTVLAVIVQAADAISSARPGARRDSLESYVKRLENIEAIANSFEGVKQSFAIQAGREIRVMVKPEEVDDNKTFFIAKGIAKKLESELEYPGQIKVSVIREIRSVEYAK